MLLNLINYRHCLKGSSMKNSEIYRFIAGCLALGYQPELARPIADRLKSDDFPIDRFVLMASNHLVLPAVYHNLRRFELLHYFPEELTYHLEEIFQLNVARNEQIIRQVEEISHCLGKSGINPVYLKGTGNLLSGLYMYPGERMIGDIDLLVEENEYLEAARLILELGYRDESRIYTDVKLLKHYPRLFRPDVPADIEIHRLAVPIEYDRWFTSKSILNSKTAVQERYNVYVPSFIHRTLHNFIHGQLGNKGYLYRLVPLRDLHDLFLLSQKVVKGDLVYEIEEKAKTKADCYFYWMETMYYGQSVNPAISSCKSRHFLTQCTYMLDHPRFHHYYIQLLKLYELLVVRYIGRIFRAFIYKESRIHVINRMKDPAWYKMHLRGLKDFFR
mgnify:CR=1 FL=1